MLEVVLILITLASGALCIYYSRTSETGIDNLFQGMIAFGAFVASLLITIIVFVLRR